MSIDVQNDWRSGAQNWVTCATPSGFDLNKLRNLPGESREGALFCCWLREAKQGRIYKLPYDPQTGKRASTAEPSQWSRFENALRVLEQGKYHKPWAGIGRRSDYWNDGILMLDIDNCIGDDGAVIPFAQDLLDDAQSYAERSPSGRGLRVAFRAKLPASFTEQNYSRKLWSKGTVPDLPGVEVQLFISDQYVTLTGDTIKNGSNIVADARAFLERLLTTSGHSLLARNQIQPEGRSVQRPGAGIAGRAQPADKPVLDFKQVREKRVDRHINGMRFRNPIFAKNWVRKADKRKSNSEYQWDLVRAYYFSYNPSIHEFAFLAKLWCDKHKVPFRESRVHYWWKRAQREFAESGRIPHKEFLREKKKHSREAKRTQPTTPPNTVGMQDKESAPQAKFRKHRGTGKKCQEVRHLRSQGLSVAEIAAQLGITKSAVYKHLEKADWAEFRPLELQALDLAHTAVESPSPNQTKPLPHRPLEESVVDHGDVDPAAERIAGVLHDTLRANDKRVQQTFCQGRANEILAYARLLDFEDRLPNRAEEACNMAESLPEAVTLVLDGLAADKCLADPVLSRYAEFFRDCGHGTPKALRNGGYTRTKYKTLRRSVAEACKAVRRFRGAGLPEALIAEVYTIWRSLHMHQNLEWGVQAVIDEWDRGLLALPELSESLQPAA